MMERRIKKIWRNPAAALILTSLSAVLTTGCADQPDYGRDPYDCMANFNALADIVGSRYCFLLRRILTGTLYAPNTEPASHRRRHRPNFSS